GGGWWVVEQHPRDRAEPRPVVPRPPDRVGGRPRRRPRSVGQHARRQPPHQRQLRGGGPGRVGGVARPGPGRGQPPPPTPPPRPARPRRAPPSPGRSTS